MNEMILTVNEWQPRKESRSREFSDIELKDAFSRVANKKDWKGRIDRVIAIKDDGERALISDAVIFFTGSQCDFVDQGNGKVRVTAKGYRSAIGM